MKNFLNFKAVLRIVGIIAIAAVVGFALVSCDIEDILGSMIEDETDDSYNDPPTNTGTVIVKNTSPSTATVTLQYGSNPSGTVSAGGQKSFNVPANVDISVLVQANGYNHYSGSFSVSRGQTKTLTFNGTTVN